MIKNKVIYIGSMCSVAEFIYFNEQFSLEAIICEENKVSNELFTYSIIRNIKLCKVNSCHSILHYIEEYGSKYIYIMCSYGRRVPLEKLGGANIFNIHYAALPYYKGRHPTYWATVNNEKYIGISIHIVTEKFDEGGIIAQEHVPYYFWENEANLFEKLTQKIPSLLDGLLLYLENGLIEKENSPGEYYKPVGLEEAYINLEKDNPNLVFNKVRSQARVGGAKINLGSICFALKDIVFMEKTMSESYIIKDEKLFIRFLPDICIVSYNFEEVKN